MPLPAAQGTVAHPDRPLLVGLAFTTQTAVILACGYVLANAPVTDRLLDRILSHVSASRTAVFVATLVGGGVT